MYLAQAILITSNVLHTNPSFWQLPASYNIVGTKQQNKQNKLHTDATMRTVGNTQVTLFKESRHIASTVPSAQPDIYNRDYLTSFSVKTLYKSSTEAKKDSVMLILAV